MKKRLIKILVCFPSKKKGMRGGDIIITMVNWSIGFDSNNQLEVKSGRYNWTKSGQKYL